MSPTQGLPVATLSAFQYKNQPVNAIIFINKAVDLEGTKG